MHKSIVALSLILAGLPACRRRPAKQPDAVAEFTQPAPAGQEEKWTEPEPQKAPEPPPPPPEPTSPPPEQGLGFTFGLARDQTVRECSHRGSWSKKAGVYYCSRTPDESLFKGKPALSFCDDKLCAVGVAIEVETRDWEAWNARYQEMKKALIELHGPPTVENENVPEECKKDDVVKCLDDGSASAEATWNWKQGHRVSLTMSKKKSGEGPSAIRFVSIANGAK
jgi:hypothetical protein